MVYDNWKVQMARKRAGFRQADVAERLGLSQCRLSHKETGKDLFTLVELNKLADLYGVGLDAFKPDELAYA